MDINRFAFVDSGALDFSGGGALHIFGGFSGLAALWILGPREGRFTRNGQVREKNSPVTADSSHIELVWFEVCVYPIDWCLAKKYSFSITTNLRGSCIFTNLLVARCICRRKFAHY